MNGRKRLPDRRQGDAVTFSHDGVTVHASMSLDERGGIAEVFFNAGKIGTSMDIAMREIGVILSIALQYGVPLATIEAALPRLADGSPAGPTGTALDLLKMPWPERPRTISAPDAHAHPREYGL